MYGPTWCSWYCITWPCFCWQESLCADYRCLDSHHIPIKQIDSAAGNLYHARPCKSILGLTRPTPQAYSVPGWGLKEQNGEALTILKHSSINLADDKSLAPCIRRWYNWWIQREITLFLQKVFPASLSSRIPSSRNLLWCPQATRAFVTLLWNFILLPSSEESLLRAGPVLDLCTLSKQPRGGVGLNKQLLDWIQLRKQWGRLKRPAYVCPVMECATGVMAYRHSPTIFKSCGRPPHSKLR